MQFLFIKWVVVTTWCKNATRLFAYKLIN